MKQKFTVLIDKEDWYISRCLENNIASQGKDVDEALSNLKEAIELYYPIPIIANAPTSSGAQASNMYRNSMISPKSRVTSMHDATSHG